MSPAAVILESIPAAAGFPMPEPGYLRRGGQTCAVSAVRSTRR